MEDRLKYILSLVNDWLKFAEAKNAALLVALGAVTAPVLDHFPNRDAEHTAWLFYLFGCALLLLALFVCLGSFLPRLAFLWKPSKRPVQATDNLYYFGNIAHLSAFDYLTALYQAEINASPNRKLEADLAGQIVTNASIANAKFIHFRVSMWCALLATILMGFAAKCHFAP